MKAIKGVITFESNLEHRHKTKQGKIEMLQIPEGHTVTGSLMVKLLVHFRGMN